MRQFKGLGSGRRIPRQNARELGGIGDRLIRPYGCCGKDRAREKTGIGFDDHLAILFSGELKVSTKDPP